jgi:hypothetical protein
VPDPRHTSQSWGHSQIPQTGHEHWPGAAQPFQPHPFPAQPLQGPGPTSPPNRRKWLHWVGYPLTGLFCLGAGVAIQSSQDAGTGEGQAKPAATATVAGTPDAAPVAEPAVIVPDPTDYEVTAKTTSKQCFGSAGCSVTVQLILGSNARVNGVAAQVTVTVTGDESGPTIKTIDVTEDGQYSVEEVRLSTPSNGTKVKAQITDVSSF